MWYAPEFCDFLTKIVELPIVAEVVIINNNVKETPDHIALKNHKIRMHDMPEKQAPAHQHK